MSYNLSNTERTLLSAYLDGEISAAERVQAEQLLTRSEGARAYLNEIRAVDGLSGIVLAGAPLTESVAATSFSAKLSGRAIEAAAEKAVYSKALALGSWGLAGAAGVAAVVAGVVLSVSTPSQPIAVKPPVNNQRNADTRNLPEQISPQPVIDLDTSNLLVSPMTPADLFAFAVDGTLPIDSKRGSYIRLAPQGKASMALEMHAEAPEDISNHLPSLDAPALAMFDSIQRVVRTSLLQCSNERIALRADLQSLRLGVIRSFERAAPHMPMEIRERLDRSRMQIAAVQRRFGAEMAAGEPEGAEETHSGGIPYLLVSFGGGDDRHQPFLPSEERVVFTVSDPAVMIDQRELVALQRMVPVPPMPPLFTSVDESREMLNSSPAGVRPRARGVKRYVSVGQQEEIPPQQIIMHRDIPAPPQTPDGGLIDPFMGARNYDINRMREALERADEAVRRADSIMQRVQKDLQINLRNNEIRIQNNGGVMMHGSHEQFQGSITVEHDNEEGGSIGGGGSAGSAGNEGDE